MHAVCRPHCRCCRLALLCLALLLALFTPTFTSSFVTTSRCDQQIKQNSRARTVRRRVGERTTHPVP
eukprot:4803221-Pleurochrysis_carterae.AAC.1